MVIDKEFRNNTCSAGQHGDKANKTCSIQYKVIYQRTRKKSTYHSPIVLVVPSIVIGIDQRGALISLFDRPFMAYCTTHRHG